MDLPDTEVAMRGNERITLIIPCLNEEEGLRGLLPEVPAWVDEVLVVDNDSTDRTADVARAAGARVIIETRRGYGYAHQAGIRAATGGILTTLDGDGQYPPRHLDQLVDLLLAEEADLAVGCRVPFPKGSIPLLRRLGNAILNLFGTALFGTVLRDNQSGMWALRRHTAEALPLTRSDMAFSEELKYRAIRKGLRVREAFVGYRPRAGTSKLVPLSAGFKNLLYLVRLRFESKRRTPAAVRRESPQGPEPGWRP